MKRSSKALAVHGETIRNLTDLRGINGGKWTTRNSDGLPCTNEPTSTQTCPPPPSVGCPPPQTKLV